MPTKDGNKKKHFWTEEKDAYLKEHYSYGNITEIAEQFGKTRQSIMTRASRIGLKSGRFLTEEQKSIIENYSNKSNQKLSAQLGKDELTIRKARKLYGCTLIDGNFDRLTCAEIGRLVGKDKSTISKCWCGKGGLRSKVIGKRYRFVKITDLLKWMQEHPSKWDATKCDKYFFGKYDWFSEKRDKDFDRMIERRWKT